MENREILEYIRSQLAVGQTESALRQHMVANGWSEQAVSNIFTLYHISTMAVPQPLPITPAPRAWLKWVIAAGCLALIALLAFWLVHQVKPTKAPAKQSATSSVLQQSANDAARKNDISRIMAGVTGYASNNTGHLPQQTGVGETPSTLLFCGVSCNSATASAMLLGYYKPANVRVQPYEAGLTVTNDQDVYIVTGVGCAADGGGIGFPESSRNFVVLYGLTAKSGLTQHCTSV